jgi:DNA-binding MarR family transcriptional regulator
MASRDQAQSAVPRGAELSTAAERQLPHPVVLFRLLKLSNLLTRPFFANFSGRYQLSLNDLRVLMTLASMSQAAAHEIAEAAGIHPMNVSRSVAALRRAGRVEERRDPDNRRRKILSLTPEGLSLNAKLEPHVDAISEFAFSAMSPEDEAFFGELLELLILRLQAVDPASPLLIDARALEEEEARHPSARGRRPPSSRAD